MAYLDDVEVEAHEMLLPNSPSALYDSPEATFNPTTTKNKRLISYALIVAGAATAAWCIYKATATISWSSSPSHNSHDAFFRSFAGINPEYLSELNASEYSALSDQDFRGLKAAESSRLLDLGFSGQECISPLQDALCPIPGACLPALSASSTTPPCAQWRRGYITDALPKAAERQQQSAHEQAEIGATWDQDGSFDQDLAWIPSQHPDKWQHFSTDRARSCLQGKRILFQGDSIMRHAFDRLVALLRGAPTRVSVLHHGLGMYTLFANATDELRLQSRDPNNSAYSKSQDESSSDVFFRIFFNWNNYVQMPFQEVLQPIQDLEVDHAVIGTHYHYPVSFDWTTLPPALDRFYNETAWPGLLSWFATPQIKPERAWEYTGRNAIMRSYANYQRQKNQRAIFVLPSDRIAEAADSNGAPQRDCRYEAGDTKCLEDLHWACAAPIPPREVIPSGIESIKAPVGYDCRDMYNLAVIDIWLNSICPIG